METPTQDAVMEAQPESRMSSRFGQLGRHMSVALQESGARVGQAFQDTQAGQALQESTTRVCAVCQTRILRVVAMTCQECSRPCCQTCTTSVALWNPTGESSLAHPGPSVRVCNSCVGTARQKIRQSNVAERMKRTTAFLQGRMEPYKYSPESKVEQSFRIGGHVMYGLKNVAGYIPVAGTAVSAINAGYYIVRYGPLVLTGNDVVMALQLLVGLATKLNLLPVLNASPQDFFGGLYYMMGESVGERGKVPELEYLEHVDHSGSAPAPSRELLLRLRHLVRLLFCTVMNQDSTPTDAQRLFRQVLPGSELVLGELSSSREIPSYFLVCTRQDKMAYLVVPGTRNSADIATDVNAEVEPLLHGSAHKGMTAGARWLLGEVGPVLVHLYTQGYQVTIVGHSLGAAYSALLTVMLRPQISSLICYGFGMPACVDEILMTATIDCIVSVVNRDDLVPRLTVQNVEALTESTLCPAQVAKTNAWMEEDWKAVQDYKRVLELRRRENPSAAACVGTDDEKVQLLVEAGLTKAAAERALAAEGGDVTRALLRGTEEEEQGNHGPSALQASDGNASSSMAADQSSGASLQQRLEQESHKFLGHLSSFGAVAGAKIQAWSSEAATRVQRGASEAAVSAYTRSSTSTSTGAKDLTRFFIPGQVIHIYNQNGLGRAALAPATHDIFARINVCSNMLEDHKVRSYDMAMRQACIVDVKTPTWESFEQRLSCACCGSDFNWAYVLQSEPQRMLARNHCFKCGRCVCDGCSHTRQAWPELGAIAPVRTCDACIFNPEQD